MKRILIASVSAMVLWGCSQAPLTDAPRQETAKTAKNVILFVGDGMGVSTVTAMRIFDGQSQGKSGEEHVLPFEKFDNLALIKTYNLDAQVADSAGTASAMNTGIKTQISKINVTPDALDAGCTQSGDIAPATLAGLAKEKGLSIGIVSTARITHATPAAVFGHASARGFESDANLTPEAIEKGCPDLAQQLIRSDVDYALGGGLAAFTARNDEANLLETWSERSDNHVSVKTAAALRALPQSGKNVLGLFKASHMSFEADRDNDKEPSIAEMTTLAIKNLEARNTGYYLMVEGGRIDHAHHGTNAYRALTDGQAFSRAVQAAVDNTNPEETLILVTADHSHVFTIAGYPARGNPILGLVKSPGEDADYLLDADGNPYTTLGYHNGPNARKDGAQALTDEIVTNRNYRQVTAVRMDNETHAGEDVALYATGPGSQRVKGVMDQTEIFNVMASALDLSTDN